MSRRSTAQSPPAGAQTIGFASDLAVHGHAPALISAAESVSYAELARRVDGLAERLAGGRRLFMLAGCNRVEALTTYLAALATGNPVILVAGDRPDLAGRIARVYDPDVVAGPFEVGADGDLAGTGDWRLTERRARSAHELHPELALLLSTSGSTGSPKLVRLSYAGVAANAAAIATTLQIAPDDRAATTLPMHYCYGLSVVHSHLCSGAALILTDRSVVAPEFWDLFRYAGGTSFAGVPHTFQLLDRIGFERMRLPLLRSVTQAGGRLHPDDVRRFAALARRGGWRFFVMYGQTEATARMAVLPAELAETRAGCIGRPVPGGAFRIEPLRDGRVHGAAGCAPEVGELVYEGPNVMLGYAECPHDLAAGRTVTALRTGDLARRHADGLYEIVGRRSRFIKVFGLRVDLDRVEVMLREETGTDLRCAGDDERLVVGFEGAGDADAIRAATQRLTGLPSHVIRIRHLEELPMLPSGKPDLAALLATSPGAGRPDWVPERESADPRSRSVTSAGLCAVFAEILDRPDARPDQSFVELGGDSLSFVEMSIRLEEEIGHLPPDWHTTPIAELVPTRPVPPRRHRRLDVSAAVRAAAIVLIVGTHSELFRAPGGAHLLVGACGFNFARFHLTQLARPGRLSGMWRALRRIALASMLWIGAVTLVTADYGWGKALLLHNVTAGGTFNEFWFIETLVYTLLVVTALMSLPWVDRLERRIPFAVPVALMLVALVPRYALHPGDRRLTPLIVFWLFALGWAAAKATSTRQRWVMTVAAIATVPGFFEDPPREAVVLAGLVVMIWVKTIPSHAAVNRAVAALAGASLYIYLTHWQVYLRIYEWSPIVATLASLAVGVLYAAVARRAGSMVATRRYRREATLRAGPSRLARRMRGNRGDRWKSGPLTRGPGASGEARGPETACSSHSRGIV